MTSFLKFVFVFLLILPCISVPERCDGADVSGLAMGNPDNPVAGSKLSNASRFIPVFTWNYQSGDFSSTQESALSKYSFSDLGRRYYRDKLGQNTWSVLKSLNSSHEIYLYEFPMGTRADQDGSPALYINTISRWNKARGHSMGNLHTNNSHLFLLDSEGRRIKHNAFSWWLLDIGSPGFQRYWIEAVTADIVNQPWKADGIYIDGPNLVLPSGITASPAKYSSDASWVGAAISYTLSVTAALHAQGVKAWFNLGPTSTMLGKTSWITLDSSPDHPDVMMEEGAFVTSWSSTALGNFFNEDMLKNSIDTMQAVRNSRVAMSSHAKGLPENTGIDNYGRPATYWDAFYFSLGCFLLGKNTADNNSYFSWHDDNPGVQWFDEFDIDLGAARVAYQVKQYGASNIYWREYEKGYVYVNPSNVDAKGIVLADVCRLVTHANITNPFRDSTINALDLPAHRAAILVRSSVTGW